MVESPLLTSLLYDDATPPTGQGQPDIWHVAWEHRSLSACLLLMMPCVGRWQFFLQFGEWRRLVAVKAFASSLQMSLYCPAAIDD